MSATGLQASHATCAAAVAVVAAWAAKSTCVPSDNYPGSPTANCSIPGFTCHAELVSGQDAFSAQCSAASGATIKFQFTP